jgi:hypothetical protein
MTTRQINPTSRRFAKQALKSVTQGRIFGRGRRSGRALQQSTTSASAVSLGTAFTQHDITTDGTGLVRVVNVGVVGPFAVGQRKIVRLATRGGGSDTFTMDATSLVRSTGAAVASLTFNALGQTAYFEWNGAKWTVLSTTAVLT